MNNENDEPEFVADSMFNPALSNQKTWTLKFTEYWRDNLLSLLTAFKGVADTGDWFEEIRHALDFETHGPGMPNTGAEELRKHVFNNARIDLVDRLLDANAEILALLEQNALWRELFNDLAQSVEADVVKKIITKFSRKGLKTELDKQGR